VLCDRLGIPLAYKDIVFQGTQDEIVVDGWRERVGFYNTFVGRVGAGTSDAKALPDGVEVDADPATGDVHLVRGPHFRGIQFHAESILTQHGAALIHRLAADLIT
jgi:phenazine biosynthesis protein phzE